MILSPSSRHSLRHLRDVIVVLVSRDHKARYKSTAAGMIWAVASPLLFLLTFYFLFKFVLNFNVPRYASHVFVGIVVWSWLQGSLMEAVSCISANPSLVSQPRFPTAALPVVAVTSNLLNFMLSWPLLVIILLVEGAKFGPALLALPLLMLCQFVLALGLGYFVSALNVTFRDTQHILPIILQLGYFTTPIFYDAHAVPASARALLGLNPMFHIVEGYRRILMDDVHPDWLALAVVFAGSLLVLALSFVHFQRASTQFLEEI